MNLVLLVDSLSDGGAEKVGANLSLGFEEAGYNVLIISFQNKIDYEYGGKLINLGKLKTNDISNISNKISRIIFLKKKIDEFKPKYIIDFRSRYKYIQEIVLYHFIFKNHKTILTIQSSHFDYCFIKSHYWSKKIHNNIYKTICVSKGVENLVVDEYGIENTKLIYNPITYTPIKINKNLHSRKFILAVGRMNDDVKGFDYLINAYANSKIKNEVDLLILGDGKLLTKYKQLASELNISNKIFFKGFKSNIEFFFNQAIFFIMSSRKEGFPMTILESLSLETPVVSFDTPTGPSEIIKHEYNGLLVEYLNTEKLTEAMDRMYLDRNLYKHCKGNSKKSVTKFNLNNIIEEWKKLF